jgi:hypothetical protein
MNNIENQMPTSLFTTSFFKSPALWFILIGNILLIIDYQRSWLSAMMVVMVYWTQSIIIGVFHFLRMLLLKNFSTEGFTVNGEAVSPQSKANIGMALFFAVHYGIFHLAFLFFTPSIFMNMDKIDTTLPAVPAYFIPVRYIYYSVLLFFFVSQLLLFIRHLKDDKINPKNIGSMMFTPYLRVIPFHLAVIVGAHIGGGSAFLFFLILKLIIDVVFFAIKKI